MPPLTCCGTSTASATAETILYMDDGRVIFCKDARDFQLVLYDKTDESVSVRALSKYKRLWDSKTTKVVCDWARLVAGK